MNKLRLFLALFQAGEQVVNKDFWLKSQAVVVPIIVSLLLLGVQLGKLFGVIVPLDDETCYMLAGLIYFVVNTVILFVTNKRLGFSNPPEAPSEETPDGEPSPTEQPVSDEPVAPPEAVAELPIEDMLSLVDMLSLIHI